MFKKLGVFVILLLGLAVSVSAGDVKALIVTGGCCHDYKNQKDIVAKILKDKAGIESDVLFEMKADAMKAALQKPDWHKPYGLIVYNHCHAHEKDKDFVDSIAKIHHEGKPAIALHCAMHTWHWKIQGEKSWTKVLGAVSPNHGPKSKIDVTVENKEHPVMKGVSATWLTPQGELQNIKEMLDTATVLAKGVRAEKGNKTPTPCIWVNTYGKGKIFACTLGHHNETMEQEEFKTMLGNAAKWMTGQ